MDDLNHTPENIGFYDLMDNAEAGIVKRAATRYLVTRNYERSISMYKKMGTPIFRKIVMGTVGRIMPAYSGGNYRLNPHNGKLGAANNFAFKASVFNELVHTYGAAPSLIEIAINGFELNAGKIPLAINLACVALQRYNRARMIGFIDRRLKSGSEFDERYISWTGIDNRAIDNIRNQNIEEYPVCLNGIAQSYFPRQEHAQQLQALPLTVTDFVV